MIVSKPLQDAMRGVGRNALDLPVAGLAAFAVAFLAFAMPGDMLAGLIGATGLPSLLPAAEPPLGMTARIAIGGAGAAATFGLVFYLLRVLDRSMLGSSRPRPAPADDAAPKLRRRDIHPDAPATRPILAARELGEPAPPARPAAKAPLWLDDAAPSEPEETIEAAPEELAAEAPAPEPAPEPEPEPEPAPEPEPEPSPEPAAAASTSLAELMERLERGLARRTARPAAPAPQACPQVFPDAADARLQSAIDSLQRLAARQS